MRAPSLNTREMEILVRLSAGLTDQRIADELFLSLNTIKWYNRQIYGKLDVSSRTEAIACARKLGLLEPAAPFESSSWAPTSTLPAQTTRFIGRSREIAEVKRQLTNGRLLTLTGTGGAGKTRLALRVAAEVAEDFGDGVHVVDLAPISDPSLVAGAIARALGVLENPAEPSTVTLKRALVGRESLLLIDNFEHVMAAASVLAELLAGSPRLKVLVTSRASLRLSGEYEYPVPPLSLPPRGAVSVQQLTQSEAGSLFVQRAQMVLPTFIATEENAAAIAGICNRLDGLPLAIELAAARSKLLTPHALLQRLEDVDERSPFPTLAGGSRDAPPRQRTLRDSIEWSYDLLDPDGKLLFARLAAFRGGASLEAIEAVCAGGLSTDVLDVLASLVDNSLVQQKETSSGEFRFVLLELILAYARERLEDGGQLEEMRGAHARFFVDLAERAEPELRLAHYDRWSDRFELDLENIRVALEWTLGSGAVTLGVRLASALGLFWYGKGRHLDGIRWMQRLLRHLDEVPAIHHPKFLISAGHLAWFEDLEAAERLFERALEIARRSGDALQTAWALTFLGYARQRKPDTAIPAAEQALELFRQLDHEPGTAQALNILGEVARLNGDDDRARAAYEECLAICRQTGEVRRVCYMLNNLAYIAQHEADHERALGLARQSLQLARKRRDRYDTAWTVALIAGSLGALGQPRRAAQLLSASEAAMLRMGALQQPSDQPEHDRITAELLAQLDESAFEAAWENGRKLPLEQAAALALQEGPD